MNTYCGVAPSTHKNGRGSNRDGGRTHSDWIQALAGHVESAHQGNVLKECAGCMELAKKVAETE